MISAAVTEASASAVRPDDGGLIGSDPGEQLGTALQARRALGSRRRPRDRSACPCQPRAASREKRVGGHSKDGRRRGMFGRRRAERERMGRAGERRSARRRRGADIGRGRLGTVRTRRTPGDSVREAFILADARRGLCRRRRVSGPASQRQPTLAARGRICAGWHGVARSECHPRGGRGEHERGRVTVLNRQTLPRQAVRVWRRS